MIQKNESGMQNDIVLKCHEHQPLQKDLLEFFERCESMVTLLNDFRSIIKAAEQTGSTVPSGKLMSLNQVSEKMISCCRSAADGKVT